jgi:hypothetical protein
MPRRHHSSRLPHQLLCIRAIRSLQKAAPLKARTHSPDFLPSPEAIRSNISIVFMDHRVLYSASGFFSASSTVEVELQNLI